MHASIRKDLAKLPERLNRDPYYDLVNVHRPIHYFKNKTVIPWLKKLLERDTHSF